MTERLTENIIVERDAAGEITAASYEVQCRFCAAPTATIGIRLDSLSADLTAADLGVDDSRCDDCKAEHGDYKEMHDRWLNDCGDYPSFRAAIEQADFKKTAFDQAHSVKAEEVLSEKQRVAQIEDARVIAKEAAEKAAANALK